MIADEKLRKIATSLWERSQANEVEWKRHYNSRTGVDYLEVRFPKSTIRVLSVSPTTEPDFVTMQVCNEEGTLISQLKAEEDGDDWELLSGLYSEALRYATKWDEVLSDVEKAIATPGKIGEG
jgi:hypothetical protein